MKRAYRAWAENDRGELETLGYFENDLDAFRALPEPTPEDRDCGVEEIKIIQNT